MSRFGRWFRSSLGSPRLLICGSGAQGVSVMGIVQSLSTLALRPILDGACQALGVAASAVAADRIVGKLSEQFTDHSQRLSLALGKANDHAWKTLEIALAGESLWSCLDRAEHKALRRQIREFLDATS